MIRNKLGPNVEIKPGQYVCADGLVRGTVTGPRMVTRVSGKRIYYKKMRDLREEWDGGEKAKERYMARETLRYLCDTEDEANAISGLHWQRWKEEERRITVLKQQIEEEFRPRINALIGQQ